MRRYLLLAAIPAAMLAAGSFTACSGDDNTGDAGDAAPDVTKKDAGKLDATEDTSPPVVVTPSGKQLYSSNIIQIFGVTSDNLVIFADNQNGGALYAVDAAGASPAVNIASPTVSQSSTYVAGIAGKVVFLWEDVKPGGTQEVGKLSTWTLAGGLKSITIKSNAASGFGATTDGSKILFSQTTDPTGMTGDIMGAAVDGTGAVALVTGVDIGDGTCTPEIGFAGGTKPVVATCASAPPDGGTPAATVKSFDAAFAATAFSYAGLNFWATDTAADKLMVGNASQTEVGPFDGSTANVVIDTKSVLSGFGYMKKDGATVLYSTAANDLWTAPSAGGTPVQLEASGVKYFRSLSPDDNYMIYSTNLDAKQFGSNLFLQPTTTGTATTLVSTTKGALFGRVSTDDFTADSKYVLYIDNVDNSADVGDLYYAPVTGGAGKKVTTLEWLNLSATGSKIVYNDNCTGCGVNSNQQVIGVADIQSIDLGASTPTPTTLQKGADPEIYISAPKDRVIFTYSQNVPADDGGTLANGNGLYSIAVP